MVNERLMHLRGGSEKCQLPRIAAARNGREFDRKEQTAGDIDFFIPGFRERTAQFD